jgi:hypothetical protein
LIPNPGSLLRGQLENDPVITILGIDEFDGQEINFLVCECANRGSPAGDGQRAHDGSGRYEREWDGLAHDHAFGSPS